MPFTSAKTASVGAAVPPPPPPAVLAAATAPSIPPSSGPCACLALPSRWGARRAPCLPACDACVCIQINERVGGWEEGKGGPGGGAGSRARGLTMACRASSRPLLGPSRLIKMHSEMDPGLPHQHQQNGQETWYLILPGAGAWGGRKQSAWGSKAKIVRGKKMTTCLLRLGFWLSFQANLGTTRELPAIRGGGEGGEQRGHLGCMCGGVCLMRGLWS